MGSGASTGVQFFEALNNEPLSSTTPQQGQSEWARPP